MTSGATGETPFRRASGAAEAATPDRQQRNRLWWERMPMTYVAWDAGDRLPRGGEDFAAMRRAILDNSPFLRERFDFAARAGERVLDLGCGAGVLTCLLAEAGADVTAADLTEAGVGMTARALAHWKLEAGVVRADAEHLAFAEAAFDYVLAWGVLHHTSDFDAALAEVRRVLRPGGRGLMMVYHRASVVYVLHGLYWLLVKGKIFAGHTLESVQDFYTDGYYHRYLTRGDLGGALRRAGLTPTRFDVTQYQKPILPFVRGALDRFLKRRFGMCLIAEFRRDADG